MGSKHPKYLTGTGHFTLNAIGRRFHPRLPLAMFDQLVFCFLFRLASSRHFFSSAVIDSATKDITGIRLMLVDSSLGEDEVSSGSNETHHCRWV